jgi:hypothetical protein
LSCKSYAAIRESHDGGGFGQNYQALAMTVHGVSNATDAVPVPDGGHRTAAQLQRDMRRFAAATVMLPRLS